MNKEKIFRKGSKTYYYSSLFFPPTVRDKILSLYAYARIMDDYVDVMPPKKKEFQEMKKQTAYAYAGKEVDNLIVKDLVAQNFSKKYVDAFIAAMEQDLTPSQFTTFSQTKNYCIGSAEVIGLLMCEAMDLPKVAYPTAQQLGLAMQLINFVRDIDEDLALNRWYLPTKRFSYPISREQLAAEPKKFSAFVRKEIARYEQIDDQARKGFSYLPYYCRVPIKTAADMYRWTAKQIKKDPSIVFRKKVKPSKGRILLTALLNMVIVCLPFSKKKKNK